ncbi:MAG: hypothetical protein II008_19330 [Oscillospiraceae bacterium]|nr:hypothetical protein [Oscillospiraceae bacterium]
MNCNNYFDMTDQGDSFETWQGLRGPAGPQGPAGAPGAPGTSVELRGPVDTTGDLPATASSSELWLVGSASPYDGYFFNGASWESLGQIAVGPAGADGVSPEISVTDIPGGHRVTITDAGGTEAFDVMDGEDGSPGATPDLQIGEVTTGAPGSAAEATITGTPEEPRLNLTLPRGQQGPAVPLATSTPLMDGTASAGSGTSAAHEDHVHPTDTSRASAAALATYVRPNLLDNWCFVGGGSQLGYGVFPVNQRGQTSYTNSGYFIDRWSHTLLSATIVAQYVTIANTTASPHAFSQPLNNTSAIKGKTVTLSFLTDTALVSATISLPAATSTDWTDGQIHIYGDIATYFGSIRLSLINGALSVYVIVNANTNVNFLAAKLEIGSTQTLAHQENGAWVLNEVPDYAEELVKCQAYYYPLKNGVCTGYLTSGGTAYYMAINTPCKMARAPTASLTGYIARTASGYSLHTPGASFVAPTSLSVAGDNPYTIIDTLSASAGDTNNTVMVYQLSGLVLSAE